MPSFADKPNKTIKYMAITVARPPPPVPMGKYAKYGLH